MVSGDVGPGGASAQGGTHDRAHKICVEFRVHLILPFIRPQALRGACCATRIGERGLTTNPRSRVRGTALSFDFSPHYAPDLKRPHPTLLAPGGDLPTNAMQGRQWTEIILPTFGPACRPARVPTPQEIHMPRPKFRVGDRVEVKDDPRDRGTIVPLPRTLRREQPQLEAVLLDGTENAIVYHCDDLRRLRTASDGGQSC